MLRQTSQLYDPMVERDTEGIRDALTALRVSESSDALLDAVVRFSVLAFCPSQHSKAALCASVAAKELAPAFGLDLDALIAECAIYAADSRAPWSEPPIGSAPPIESEQSGSIDELRSSIEARDRLRGELWLAKALTLDDFPTLFFEGSLLTLPCSEQGVIVAAAAWRIAQKTPREHWFATLRIAVAEWTQGGLYPSHHYDEASSPAAVLQQIVSVYEADEGSPLSFQSVALFDAADAMREVSPRAFATVMAHLSDHRVEVKVPMKTEPFLKQPVYRLARDYAAYLQSVAMRSRLAQRYDDALLERIASLAQHNLNYADSYEEWSFA